MQHRNAVLFNSIAGILTVLFLVACPVTNDPSQNGPEPIEPDLVIDEPVVVDASVLAALKASLRSLAQPESIETAVATPLDEELLEESEPVEEQGLADGAPVTYRVTTRKYSASASFDTQVLLNPSTDVIYPGSVILGHTIDDGSYQEVTNGSKNALTISFDLSGVKATDGGAGAVSASVIPTLSSYRELRNQILAQDVPPQTSIYSMEKMEINSEEELGVKLTAGASFKGGVYETSIKSGFDFNDKRNYNKVMVRFMQTFYTVDIDQGAGTFIYQNFDIEDFGGYRPVYVSSVAYGRLAYITVESTASVEQIMANLDVAITVGSNSGDASVETAKSFLKDESSTKITVIGGNTVATDLDSFMEMIRDDDFSASNAGSIISYKLRFVDDNSIANTVFNGEYTVRNTETVMGEGINLTLQVRGLNAQANDTNSNLEIYGKIAFKVGEQTKYLWDYSPTNYLQLPSTYTNYPDHAGPAQSLNLASVNTDFTIELFNMGEADDRGDESFQAVTKAYTAGSLTSGTPFQIKTIMVGHPDEYLEFTIVPTIEYLY